MRRGSISINFRLGVTIFFERKNHTRSSHRRCFIKKVSIKNSQNSRENTCARVFFLIKLEDSACNLIKKRLWHRYFPENFAKFFTESTFFTALGVCFWEFASVISYIILKTANRTNSVILISRCEFGKSLMKVKEPGNWISEH